MNPPYSDLAAVLRRCQEAVDRLTVRSPAATDWTGQVADLLLALTPPARLALVYRPGSEPTATAVRTADGAAPPDCSEVLAVEIGRLDGVQGMVHPVPALGAVFGLRCLAAPLRDERGPWALLVLGASADVVPETLALTETILTACAHSLSLWRRCEAVQRERDEFAGFALAGQATVGLAHELNNVLNGMVLQASVVQLQVDKAYHAALDVIRRQANQATGLLRPLGQLSAERARAFYPVDLARAVQEVLREHPTLEGRVAFAPASAPLPPVRAAVSACKQLVHLLLSGLSVGPTLPLYVYVEKHNAGVQLRIDAAGPTDNTDILNADAVLWGRLGDIERLAGQSLLRQLEGTLRIEARPVGGVRVRVCWK